MDKAEERLLSQAANARLVHLNEQLIYPLLDRNMSVMLEHVCNEVKQKGTVDIAKIAYIAACKDLARELEAVARNGDRAVVNLDKKYNKE